MIVNFVQFPGIASARGIHWCQGQGSGAPTSLSLERESVSFIICLSSFDVNLTFDV